jgi:hypothetical protein
MTPFAAFILTDALLLGLLVCSLIWLFKTSSGAIWLKVALALTFCLLVCWSPLATRAILGYPQPRSLSELPDRFQLLAEHTADDQSFDLWIEGSEDEPLAVTVVPDKQMRSLLRSAGQKLGEGEPVFFKRNRLDAEHGDSATGESDETNKQGRNGAANSGAVRTNFGDDQTRWSLEFSNIRWRKNGDNT